MGSFWGNPTLEPKDKDVAKFLGLIRELTKNQNDKRKLSLATSAMTAIAMFVAKEVNPREALALLDKLRAEIAGNQ